MFGTKRERFYVEVCPKTPQRDGPFRKGTFQKREKGNHGVDAKARGNPRNRDGLEQGQNQREFLLNIGGPPPFTTGGKGEHFGGAKF